jgi:acetoacetyl-CoA synthetase
MEWNGARRTARMGAVQVVAPLWVPDAGRRQASRLASYLDRHGFAEYDAAWAWSVAPETAGAFWRSVAEEFAIEWRSEPRFDLHRSGTDVAGADWFGGARLNYAERALRPPPAALGPAVISRSQTRPEVTLTWGELTDLVARIRAGLVGAGVRAGDRVAACLPNIPETLAAMLATASLGAVWACCAPEMGVTGVLDRLAQLEPTVLLVVDGYRYGSRTIERAEDNEAVRTGLPTVTRAFWLGYLRPGDPPPAGWAPWEDLTGRWAPLEFAAVAFDHPLYVLFSSGTTGKPKAIIHCHGGILLEHAKALGLHFDLGPADRFFWFTTTGWMMWNFCVSGLLVGAAVVTFDGDPSWPGPDALWALMAETRTTCGGVGAGYLVASMKARVRPGAVHDLGPLKTLGSTGSPLPAAAAEWVYQEVAGDLLLASFSGGTDVCTGFVGGSPIHPVWAGEISCRCLGAAVEVFDDDGRPVRNEEGELVLTAPLPSMPVGFWADPDGTRYRAAYFERFPGVWAHGDRATLTDRGTCIITGRSDGTLNRGGVRMGTAEFYSVVEQFDEVADSLVVHVEDEGGGPGELWLFVVLAGDARPDLERRLRAALRGELSPRYAPDRIEIVTGVPRTLSGKKLEVPVKRILTGVPAAQALTLASVANPESLEAFVALAHDRTGRRGDRPAGEKRQDIVDGVDGVDGVD